MIKLNKDKTQIIKEYLLITLGVVILSICFNLFFVPYHITPGGLSSWGIIVNSVTQGMFPHIPYFENYNGAIPVGLFNLVINIPLFILGVKVIGKGYGFKAVYGIVLLGITMDYVQYFLEKNFNGDMLQLSDDLLLASLYGGVTVGLSLGIIFSAHASTGGTDVIAMIFSKLSKSISIGKAILIIDSVVIMTSIFVFKEWKLPLYSLISLWVISKVIDIYLQGMSINKAVLVISNKESLIKYKILHGINKGGSIIPIKGMFSNEDKSMIFSVMGRREVAVLRDYIKQIDPNAFIVLLDAHETIGEGFKSIHEDF